MCQALMEMMEPQLLLREQEGLEKGLKKGIQVAVNILRDIGRQNEEIQKIIAAQYDISETEAAEYL